MSLTYKDCSGLNLDQISSGPNLEVSRIFHLSSFSWDMRFENKRAIAVTLLRQAQDISALSLLLSKASWVSHLGLKDVRFVVC